MTITVYDYEDENTGCAAGFIMLYLLFVIVLGITVWVMIG